MQIGRYILSIIMSIMCSLMLSAKTINDTIMTTDSDMVILTYELTHSEDKVTIRFTNQRKKLGRVNEKKYKDLSKIAVMFFDRTGDFDRNVSILDMVPEAFMVPYNVSYAISNEGFFVVQESPILNFTVREKTKINIPIYLAYHSKKGKYALFSKSNGLTITLGDDVKKSLPAALNDKDIKESSSRITVIESDNTVEIKILESIALATALMEEENRLPLSETLTEEISFLRQQKRVVTDETIVSKINGILTLYDDKVRDLENKRASEQEAVKRMEEEKRSLEQRRIEARRDSISAEQKAKEEKEKTQNMWLLILGISIAVIAFVANQVIQHFRNKSNQKNMMEMQQSIANKAEEEAKRKAAQTSRGNKQNPRTTIVRKQTTIKIKGKEKDLTI